MTERKLFGKTVINVTGTTFNGRQGVLWNLRKHDKDAYITLRRERKNEKDPNAIAVIAHTKDTKPGKIGYVPANIAAWLAKYMDEGMIVRAYRAEKDAEFVIGNGRKNKGNLGCKLRIVYELRPTDIAYEREYE